MKLLLFGSTGMIGQRVLAEALRRGHPVIAVARDPSKVTAQSSTLTLRRGDVTDAPSVAARIIGNDVVVRRRRATRGTGRTARPHRAHAGGRRYRMKPKPAAMTVAKVVSGGVA